MGWQLRLRLPTSSSRNTYSVLPSTSTPSTPHSSTILTPPSKLNHRRNLIILGFCIFSTLFVLTGITRSPALSEQAENLVVAGKAGWDHGVGYLSSVSDGWDEPSWMENLGSIASGSWGTGKQALEASRCKGWDPELGEEMDPMGCVRARQYRQVMRVLEREEKSEHAHWYFTKKHNLEVFKRLSKCFLPDSHEDYIHCPDKPLIISGWWYSAEVLLNGTTGEVIWQTSLFKQITEFGLSIACVGPYENWVEVAEMMPDVYRFIWSSDVDIVSCITDPRCVAGDQYVPPVDSEDLSVGLPKEELGVIPIWKLQVVDYWGSRPKEMSNNDYWWGLKNEGDWSYQPLGQQWVATPWPLPGHVHLPYSIEEYCMPLPIVPHKERNDTVLIFAKKSSYFHYHWTTPASHFSQLAKEDDMTLLLTAAVEEGKPLPEGLETMGMMSRDKYEELVGSVKVMLGMGAPLISPSVYSSLCQATPVVLPYFVEKWRTDGWFLYSGFQQHGPASMIGPPYVYSYYSNNYTDMVDKVRQAMSTPIERYIPENMRWDYALTQMGPYLERDLYELYKQSLAANGGEIPRLISGARERCYELDRCRPTLKEGRIPSTPENRVGKKVVDEAEKLGEVEQILLDDGKSPIIS